MDPVQVTARDGIFAAFVVCMAGFVAGIVWWVIKSKGTSDQSDRDSAKETNKTLLDLSVRTIEKVGAGIEKVGDNIEKQTGHMVALTESTQQIKAEVGEVKEQVTEHGRMLGEHSTHLLEIRKSLGAKQA